MPPPSDRGKRRRALFSLVVLALLGVLVFGGGSHVGLFANPILKTATSQPRTLIGVPHTGSYSKVPRVIEERLLPTLDAADYPIPHGPSCALISDYPWDASRATRRSLAGMLLTEADLAVIDMAAPSAPTDSAAPVSPGEAMGSEPTSVTPVAPATPDADSADSDTSDTSPAPAGATPGTPASPVVPTLPAGVQRVDIPARLVLVASIEADASVAGFKLFRSIKSWLNTNGYEAAGPALEMYRDDGVVEIEVPLRRKGSPKTP